MSIDNPRPGSSCHSPRWCRTRSSGSPTTTSEVAASPSRIVTPASCAGQTSDPLPGRGAGGHRAKCPRRSARSSCGCSRLRAAPTRCPCARRHRRPRSPGADPPTRGIGDELIQIVHRYRHYGSSSAFDPGQRRGSRFRATHHMISFSLGRSPPTARRTWAARPMRIGGDSVHSRGRCLFLISTCR